MMRRLQGMMRRVRGPFFVLLFVCVTVALLARAGGGENYSPPSGGGSGGGGGGDGGSDLVFFLLRLLIEFAIEYPTVGVPLLIVVVVIIVVASIYGSREGTEQYVDFTIRRGDRLQKSSQLKTAEQALRNRDPAWNSAPFLTRMKKGFMAIQDGWSRREPAAFQNFVSDGVWERFTLQIDELRSLGRIDRMEKVQVLEATIAHVQSDAQFDTVHVRFRASAVNQMIEEKTGRVLHGSGSPTEFVEFWSFLRRPGAKTLAKGGLIEGFCPNCAAPIEVARLATCVACGSFLRSGEFDWVLAEITQEGEFNAAESPMIPGLEAFTKLDAGFNRQVVEDRASVAFWRRRAAERSGEIGPLRRMALEEHCQALQAELAPPENGERTWYQDIGVGAVDMLGVQAAEPFDRTFVQITWTGRRARQRTGAAVSVDNGAPSHFRSIFAFVRKHGVVTDLKHSLASAHCVNCGAPEKTGQEPVCEYCGTVQNDGSRDWVLEKVRPASDREMQTALSQIAPAQGTGRTRAGVPGFMPQAAPSGSPAGGASGVDGAAPPIIGSGMEAMWLLIDLVLADGVVDPKETEMLNEFAKQCSVPPERVLEMIEMRRASGAGGAGSEGITDPAEGRELLRALASLALADGRLSTEELELLQAVGRRFGLNPYEVKMMTNKERTRLYAEAKRKIAAAKKVV